VSTTDYPPPEADARPDDPDAYRMRAQACPRGCEFIELARRELVTSTPFGSFGRSRVRAQYAYESSNCPHCGARLVRDCARCGKPILAPVRERCTWCGLPHPWAAERRSGLAQRPVRKWRGGEDGVNDPAEPLYRADRGEVLVLDGDILRLEVDAIISNDDVDGRMWTEIAHAIRIQGGGEIERLARERAPQPIGQAWVTIAGELPVERIVHVASMNRRGTSTAAWVGACLLSALAVAQVDDEIASLGLATINSGPNAIPFEVWSETFASACVAHLHPSKQLQDPCPAAPWKLWQEVVLVLYEPEDFEASLSELRLAFDRAWRRWGEPRDGGVVGPVPDPRTDPKSRFHRAMERLTRRSAIDSPASLNLAESLEIAVANLNARARNARELNTSEKARLAGPAPRQADQDG
jgi:O-acetyl-ADP-ribose deacetylase (regulator of RNase III)